MSICGTLVTLALNATLLGHQGLTVIAVRSDVNAQSCTPEISPIKANALVTFKDSQGREVYGQKIYVNDVDFMITSEKHAIAPLKEAMVMMSVPLNQKTAAIKSVELEFLDGSYKKVTKVKMPQPQVISVASRGATT